MEQEIIDLTQRMLDAISAQDWETYRGLCDPQMTCFEPEAVGHLVKGLPFHEFYFAGQPKGRTPLCTISQPSVHVLGSDAAAICFVRLIQRVDEGNMTVTEAYEETRIWKRKLEGWKMVHLHRSQ